MQLRHPGTTLINACMLCVKGRLSLVRRVPVFSREGYYKKRDPCHTPFFCFFFHLVNTPSNVDFHRTAILACCNIPRKPSTQPSSS